MNSVIITGYVRKKTQYKKNEKTDKYEFKFYVNCYNPLLQCNQVIPCKCEGWLADECYSNLSEGGYVEANGTATMADNNRMYIMVNSLIYKKPKSRKQFYIKAKDFLQCYNPTSVLERIKKK